MDIKDINPFLRFANTINFSPVRKNFRAVDNHFYFMTEDFCAMYIEGERYELKSGTAVIVPAGVDYYFEYEGKLRIVSINFDYTQKFSLNEETRTPKEAEKFGLEEILWRESFDNCVFLNKPLVVHNLNRLKPSIDAILQEYAYKKQFFRQAASGHFKTVLFEILRNCLWEGKNNESVNLVLDYIHNHYGEDIDNNLLAEIAGYHPYHLNRLVKNSTGTTLRQYLINYRMEIAQKLLRETEMRVSEISEVCGYKNFSNFSDDFKKKIGISPLKYRRF